MKREFFQSRLFSRVFISGLIFFACFVSSARAQIVPHFDCAEPIYDNTGAITHYKAYFGYENKGSAAVTVTDEPNNFFSPNPSGMYSGQQTTTFQRGYQKRNFSILIAATVDETAWIVQNRPAHSSKNPARYCDNGTSAMTYQGRLTERGAAANQPHDVEFRFFDAPIGGEEMQPRLYAENAAVTNGVFTAQLDMSSIFRKGFLEGKWMQIGVRRAGTTDTYQQLTPRQQLTSAPFAVNAKNVSGGFVQIPAVIGAAPESCNDSTRGQMFLRTTDNKLYICSKDGWKWVQLQ
jgi:hypothetical protein